MTALTRHCLAALAFLLTFQGASGFDFTPRQLLLGMRQPGGANEMVVNLGPASNLLGLPPGTTVTITNLPTSSLAQAFATLDEVIWSVSGMVPLGSETAELPRNTLWLTRARTQPDQIAQAWVRKTTSTQGTAGGNVQAVGNNAALYSVSIPVDAVANNATTVLIPAGTLRSYSAQVGPLGNWKGTFQGNVENTTPQDFVEAQGAVRSDIFEMAPSLSGEPGKHLGFFELRWNGTLTFTAAAGPIPAPQIDTVTPTTGTASGGTTVSVTGANFSSGVVVTLGGAPGTAVTLTGTSQVSFLTPAHAEGVVDLVVTNPDGQTAIRTNAFTFLGVVPPVRPILRPALSSGRLIMTFLSEAGVQYALVATNAAGLSSAVSGWPEVGNQSGTGQELSFSTAAAEAGWFFSIRAWRP